MYDIRIYEDAKGRSPIADYFEEMNTKARISKEHRIRLKKISEYINLLKMYETRAGLPTMRHIEEDIWELRPTNDRIFFAYIRDDTFLLLHHYIKKSQKAPAREIDRAKRNLQDYFERS